MSFINMVERFGKSFSVVRSGIFIIQTKGIYDSKKNVIAFLLGADVCVGDVVNSEFGESYLLTGVETLVENGKAHHIEVKCIDQNRIQPSATQSIFNIGTVNNSVVGNGNFVNVSATVDSIRSQIAEKGKEDKQTLNEVVDLLEKILENKEPVRQGMLSKFSSVMEKHSWFTSALSSAFISFLLQNIP